MKGNSLFSHNTDQRINDAVITRSFPDTLELAQVVPGHMTRKSVFQKQLLVNNISTLTTKMFVISMCR